MLIFKALEISSNKEAALVFYWLYGFIGKLGDNIMIKDVGIMQG